MITLPNSLKAWGTANFESVLKRELEQLDGTDLPLQRALSQSSYVSDEPFSITVLLVSEETACIRVKVGIFYKGLIPGCACADDPTPDNDYQEYCEIQVDIDRNTGKAGITLLPD